MKFVNGKNLFVKINLNNPKTKDQRPRIMLSKSQIKNINSLQQKKHREKLGLFVVEGVKSVREFIDANFTLDNLFYTDGFNEFKNNPNSILVSESELKKISNLKNPNQVLAVFKISQQNQVLASNLILVLDGIQDPGNLGTIIRLCDWYGIKKIICSTDTVDCFNPKVVQATMGSLSRVVMEYLDLNTYLSKTKLPIYVSLLEGKNIYKTALPKKGIIVMGNEGKGISSQVIHLATHQIHIPHFGDLQQTESLNVASATAIILSEFCRE